MDEKKYNKLVYPETLDMASLLRNSPESQANLSSLYDIYSVVVYKLNVPSRVYVRTPQHWILHDENGLHFASPAVAMSQHANLTTYVRRDSTNSNNIGSSSQWVSGDDYIGQSY